MLYFCNIVAITMSLTHSHDKIGIWSSLLCIVHCLAVPVVLGLSNGIDLHHNAWWDGLQVVFILIGFWAVRHAVKHMIHTWLKAAFWVTFAALAVSVFMHHSLLGEALNYTAAALLIVLHSLNLYLGRHKKTTLA